MRGSKGYGSFQEFAREELYACRTDAWSIDELVDDFILGDDLDLDLGPLGKVLGRSPFAGSPAAATGRRIPR